MNDKIGELIARSRYWSERAAHHTDRGAGLRCAARADLLKRAIKDELGHALGRMSGSPRELEVANSYLRGYWDPIDLTKLAESREAQLELPLMVCAWSVRELSDGEVPPVPRNGEVDRGTQSVLSRVGVDTLGVTTKDGGYVDEDGANGQVRDSP